MRLRAGIADMDQTKGLDVCQTNRRTSGVLFILTRQLIKTASFDPVPPNDVTFLLLLLSLFCGGGGGEKRREGHRSSVRLMSIQTGGRQDGAARLLYFFRADRLMSGCFV